MPFRFVVLGGVVVAVLLRVWHLAHGLPALTEEAFPFRHALTLWETGGLDPHWYAYPSLTIYLQFLVQKLVYAAGRYESAADFVLALSRDPTLAVVLGRAVAVIADAVTIVLVGRHTRRFGLVPAALAMAIVAVAPAMVRTARLIYADSVLAAFCVAALVALVAYLEHGGRRRVLVAAAMVGLATGTKYPGIALLLPLVVVIAWREGIRRMWAVAPLAVGVAALAFLVTTPYAIASWPDVARDLQYMGDTTTRGGLGQVSGPGWSFQAKNLAANFGLVGLVLVLASLAAWNRPEHRDAVRLQWLTWLVLLVPVLAVPVQAERYLVPAIAVGATLVAAGAMVLLERGSARSDRERGSLAVNPISPTPASRNGRHVVAIATILAVAQPAWGGALAAMSGRTSTERDARAWCEVNVSAGELILSEQYGPVLLTHRQKSDVMMSRVFRQASLGARTRYVSQPALHMVWMPLLIGGYARVTLPVPGTPEIDVHPHAVDWNAATYDLRLLRGVDVVITTDAVRGRFAADPARYHEQARWYRFLDSLGVRAADFVPDRWSEGSRITIHRLGPAARAALAATGPLDSLWWARTIPEKYKQAAEAALRSAPPPPDVPGAEHAQFIPWLPLWAQPLRPAYAKRYAGFANDLAAALTALGRGEPAAELAYATLTMLPEDARAAETYAAACRASGDWSRAVPVLERAMGAMMRLGSIPALIRLDYAEALLRNGNRERAELLLARLEASGDPVVVAAARRLRGL